MPKGAQTVEATPAPQSAPAAEKAYAAEMGLREQVNRMSTAEQVATILRSQQSAIAKTVNQAIRATAPEQRKQVKTLQGEIATAVAPLVKQRESTFVPVRGADGQLVAAKDQEGHELTYNRLGELIKQARKDYATAKQSAYDLAAQSK